MSVPPLRPNAFSVSSCSVTVVSPFGSIPCLAPPVTLPNTSKFSSMVSVTPYLDKAGLSARCRQAGFDSASRRSTPPIAPGDFAALCVAEASARNCGAATVAGRRERDSDSERPLGRRRGQPASARIDQRARPAGAEGRDRVGESDAGKASHAKSGGGSDRGLVKDTDWTMNEAQPKLQPTCRMAPISIMRRCEANEGASKMEPFQNYWMTEG